MKNKLLAALTFGLFIFGTTTWANASPVSMFDSNDESWQIVEFPGPPYNALIVAFAPSYSRTGGNSGGAIYTTDKNANLFLFSAPAKFLGNQGSYLGGCLSFDLRFVNDNLEPGYLHPDVVLWGNNQVLVINGFQDPAAQSNAWVSYSVSLTGSAGWHFNDLDGPLASEAQIKEVLSNLTGLYIRGDYFSGLDQVYLDNVRLTATPLPTSLLFLGSGVLGLAGLRLRRRERVERKRK